MENREGEDFRKRTVLAICLAGTDRSRIIAEELGKRGYVAGYAGVLENKTNYVTEEDLVGVGSVIFTTDRVRDMFKADRRLNRILKRNGVTTQVIDVSESDKEMALQSGQEDELRKTITTKLDDLGYKDLRGRNIGSFNR